MTSSQDFFKENDYLKVTNFIDNNTSTLLYSYVLLAAQRLSTLYETLGKEGYNENRWGTFEDEQAPGDYSLYGDLIFDTILSSKLKQVEDLTGVNLVSTYSYHRLYTQGSELKRHIDRPSCEISTTLCLGYNNSNLKNSDYDWPMWVKQKDGKETAINMKPGEMLIYRGCEIEHWREPLEGLNHAQVFLHYNEKDGKYDNIYDGRQFLGLPHISNPIEPNFKKSFSLNDTVTADDKFKWIIK